MRQTLTTTLLLSLLTTTLQALSISGLQCEHKANPIGIEPNIPGSFQELFSGEDRLGFCMKNLSRSNSLAVREIAAPAR